MARQKTQGKCTVAGCGEDAKTKGLCSKHYQAMRRGDALPILTKTGEVKVENAQTQALAAAEPKAIRLGGILNRVLSTEMQERIGEEIRRSRKELDDQIERLEAAQDAREVEIVRAALAGTLKKGGK